MGDVKIPNWLKKLPLAPEFHPTDSEFADPIAYISKIEKEASAFGICKVIPPLPKPSKKSVFYNLKRSLSKSPELGPSPSASLLDQLGCRDEGNGEARAVFTTRHQELGSSSRKTKGQTTAHKQVWQSGEVYTLEQFESKSKAFARNQLGAIKEVTPLVVEALFWKAASEKPIYIEYANDVPGSGFGEPEDIGQYFHKRRRRKLNEKGQAGCEYETGVASNSYNDAVRDASVKNDSDPSLVTSENLSSQKQKVPSANNDREGTAGWKLSNCPWNLQVIARSPGSLTRFMVDDIPGVTSPMIYIGMLFSWFAWHVEDHELHSLNYLHTGSPKTWYAVPGNYAFTFEEAIRAQGYGGNLDRLAALTLLGEKTNLLSPEVVVASGIPCCRLVQNPGEFVVTFPRAYHVGFSHGFNCGEAANFGTPQWLKVAKEAAVRRAAMNYLPMLSHQQLLYLLTMSFVSSVPKALLQGARISRLKDRQKEERELLVKKAFIDDMLNQNNLLWELLGKESSSCAILWDPDLLPMPSNVSQSVQMCANPDPSGLMVGQRDAVIHLPENEIHADIVHDETSNISNMSNGTLSVDLLNSADICNSSQFDSPKLHVENSEGFSVYDDDLPCGLHVDSGTLPCVACGILGFPFMAIVQPSQKAIVEFFPAECQMIHDGLGVLRSVKHHAPLAGDQTEIKFFSDGQPDDNCGRHECISEASNYEMDVRLTEICLEKSFTGAVGSSSQGTQKIGLNTFSFLHQIRTSPCVEPNDTADAKFSEVSKGLESCSSSKVYKKWNTSSRYFRPRVFCLEHALETEKLLRARGGADVLIICHSAYRKIKAHALAVAEEIAVPYTCSEVPLENASKEELDLINVSICDESHEECVEDWTSKLGLNLSYCVNLRKLSEAKQEPALPLGGLFSEIISGSNLSKLDASSLKWNSRRARSHKATVLKESIPCQSTQIEGDIPVEKQEKSKVAGEHKIIFQYSRRKCTKNKTAQNFPSNQQPEAESRRYGHPDDNVVSIDALCSIDNTRIVSSKLGKCSPLSGNKQHEECIDKESEMSEISCPAKSLIHEKKGNDSAQLVRSSNTYHSGVQQEHYTIEETREDLSNPVNPDGSLTIENAGNDSDKLTSVENLEILHEALTTGETMEVCKVSDRENAEDLLHNGRTGDDAVELIDGKQENNMCMVDETGMVGEEFDRAKSAVLHAIYDLVVQNLETQIRSQIFEDLEVEYSRLQHKVRIADRELSNSSDPAETIESPDVANSFVDNNGEQEIDSIEEVFKGSKVSSSRQDGMSPESAHTKRSQNKRKREIEQLTEEDVRTNGFIRSPCEGLRPRTSRNTACLTGSDDGTKVETACKKARRSPNGSIFSTEKKAKETNRVHRCDLEGCQMTFETKDELNMHQSNRCTHEGCNKQFSSHKYTLSHQKVHIDERPLKCEWKGCKMSFKWTWARTEHMRVHTGERPYKCKTEGCGRTFRFVSDSSRHRRKTGHRVSPSR